LVSADRRQQQDEIMNMTKQRSTHKTALAITASILAACSASAYEVPLTYFGTNMPPLDFHGFASQGLLYSSGYNYLTPNTKEGSTEFSEAGLNVLMNPFPRTRITAQGFLFDVGDAGNYQPFLDYASAEYTFSDYIGLRAGRIRKPGGIYNDIQDVDLARTFVLLPQGIYDARFRDLSCSLDGGAIFGNIPLSKAGGLSYEAYAGFINIAPDSGVANIINNSLPPGGKLTSFDQMSTAGSQLWWNTPVNGLRFGASFEYIFNFDYNLTVPTGAPPPYPASVALRSTGPITLQQYSAEYLWKNWTFQAEYYNLQLSQDAGTTHSFIADEAWYGSAAYRVNKWLEVGGYYTEYYNGAALTAPSDASQKDLALSFRFDPTDWWVIKVEGHYLRGTALLDDNASNPVRNDNNWFMLAVKTTFSF
jgi:hypothetical protein